MREQRATQYRSVEHDPVESVSELGTVDTFVAGLLHSQLAERPIDECLAFGMAAALANRRSLGAGDFDKGDAVRLQKDVRVRALSPIESEVDVD